MGSHGSDQLGAYMYNLEWIWDFIINVSQIKMETQVAN